MTVASLTAATGGKRYDTAPAYVRVLVAAMPKKLALALVLMVMVSVTEWAGLLLLVPLLALVGLDVDQGVVGRVADALAEGFATLGMTPSLLTVLGLYVVLVITRALLVRWQTLAMVDLDKGFVLSLRHRLYRAVAFSRWVFFSRRRSSDFLHALTGQVTRAGMAATMILTMLTSVMVGVVYLLVAFRLSPVMTALACASGLTMILALRAGNRRAREAGDRLNRVSGNLLAAVSEHLAGMKTVKSFTAEERNIGIFASLTSQVADTHQATSRNYAGVRVGFDVGSVVILSVVLYVSVELLALSTAEILLLLFLFARLVPRFSGIQQQYQYFVNSMPAFGNVMNLIAACESEAEPRPTRSAPPIRLLRGVRLERISFRYGLDRDAITIHDLDLNVPACRTTAIVGPSGAGKSTIADLMMGLLQPERGRVLIDDEPLSAERLRAWRESIGYVPQETFLLHDTIRANLLWGAPDSSEAELREALRLAAADGFVGGLPHGLDTVIGDRGVLLSGGERQRLALARALLRKPSLLILDEATSALDSENERRIQEAIDALHGTMTIVVITHRLSTIRDADAIHVIDEGRLVESGSWGELLANGRRFAELCTAQRILATEAEEGRTGPVRSRIAAV